MNSWSRLYLRTRDTRRLLLNMAELRFELPEGLKVLLAELLNSGIKPYLVGGCVRDLILDREPHDFDLCSASEPLDIVKFAVENKHPYNIIGFDYGTVTVFVDGVGYEITTFRKETGYTDGRHPDNVSYASNIEEDLKRRDFTINALAYDVENDNIIDLFDGVSDIKNKNIKCVGEPSERFSEDHVRILRAIRFAVSLGFNIDDNTSKAIHEYKDKLNFVSKERITMEFEKMLSSNMPIHDIFMEYSDVIDVLIPGMEECKQFNQNNKYHKHNVYEHMLYVVDYCDTKEFEIKLAALLHDIGKPASYSVDSDTGLYHFYGHPEKSYEISKKLLKDNFRLKTVEYNRILELIRFHDTSIAPNEKSIKKAMYKHGEQFVKDYLIHKEADMKDHKNMDKYMEAQDFPTMHKLVNRIIEENAAFSIKDLKINGTEIREIAKKYEKNPTVIVGKTIRHLFDMVIDEKLSNVNYLLVEEAEKFIKEQYS